MKFSIVYGRSGTGKSSYLYNDIKKEIGNKKIYFVVPEQSNLSAETRLFKELEVETLMNVEVLTLSRMATRVLNEIGEKNRKILSSVGKDMIIYDILSSMKTKLKFLGKSEKNIDVVSRLITELKKHSITPSFLEDVVIDEQYTKLKVEDVKLIYKEYQDKISESFIDENDELTLLYENLDKVDLFKDSIIYFDDFLGFTTQEYRVFDALMKQASKIMIAIPADSLFITNKEDDIFYFNKKFASKLMEIAGNNNAEIEDILLNENIRAKSEDLKYLEEAFAYNKLRRFPKTPENISLTINDNPYDEIETVAKRIYDLVKNKNYEYKDFIIVAGTVEEYRDDIKTIFGKYNIPVFVDEKKELNQNILIKFIVSMLDVFSRNWSFESVFNYIKVGLLNIDSMKICEFENYCLKWGIKNKKWFQKFAYEPANDKQDEFEQLRCQIINPLMKFKNEVSENRTVRELTKNIYEFLMENEINVILDSKIKAINQLEITNEYNTSYKLLVGLFDEIVNIFGDEKITFEKYKEILQVGLNSTELGKIPATQDGVVFADISRSRGSEIKISFLIGVNDGKFLSNNKVEGYFNDDDRRILGDCGIELAKDSKDNMYEEQFNIYRMITLADEKIFISYSASDKSGEAIRPSLLIKKINKMFDLKNNKMNKIIYSNYNVVFDECLKQYKNNLDGEEIADEWKHAINYFKINEKEKFDRAISGLDYNNKAEQITSDNIIRMYGKTLQTSISRLEQFKGCPFSFHMKYGLKLQEKKELAVSSIDTGNFMHEVIERFFDYLNENNIEIYSVTDEQTRMIVAEIVNELLETSKYYVFSSTPKFKVLSRRLKKVVLSSIEYIVYTLKNSTFKILGNEIEFSNNSEYKPIVVELDDGKKVEIKGKIDRVDIGKLNDKEYVRIIDYKSSIKNLDYNKVVSGLQIQLVTYLDDICEQGAFEPSGILYMSLIDNIVKSTKNLDDEEIAKNFRKNFQMQGVVLADVEVAKMMDTSLSDSNLASDIVPVTLKKGGELASRGTNAIKKGDFENLQKKVKKVIKDLSTEILGGDIDIKPYSYDGRTACDYCNYKTICCFTPGMCSNDFNYINKYRKEEVLAELREEFENENNKTDSDGN